MQHKLPSLKTLKWPCLGSYPAKCFSCLLQKKNHSTLSGLKWQFVLFHSFVGWLGGCSTGLVWVGSGDCIHQMLGSAGMAGRWASLSCGPASPSSFWHSGGLRILRWWRQELSLWGLGSAAPIMLLPSHCVGQSKSPSQPGFKAWGRDYLWMKGAPKYHGHDFNLLPKGRPTLFTSQPHCL